MGNTKKAEAGTFEEEFNRRLSDIVKRGEAQGMTLTHICREAGVARATPDRWKSKPPLSVTLVDKMEAVVVAAEKSAGK
ncbi:SaPI-like transcriptional repressor [Pseudomonas phage Dolphis]|nr:SaPI-like transcriptional repressor [Pseudomonas phage Dolphis]